MRKENQKIPLRGLVYLTILLMMAFMVIVLLFTGTSDIEGYCSEIITMMLDDPDHIRLHESYPIMMMNLHLYLDENCDEELPAQVMIAGGEKSELP